MITLREEWEKEFDEKFGNNEVWWQECLAEMRIGDPDFKRLKSFILTLLESQRTADLEAIREGVAGKVRKLRHIECEMGKHEMCDGCLMTTVVNEALFDTLSLIEQIMNKKI